MDSSGESKRPRIERGQFLFVEKRGELFGIDLSGDGGSDSQNSSLSGRLRCRLDLYHNNYPLGMCHVKMKDKHYLMGGLKRNLTAYSNEYSDDVYELDTDLCRISRDMIREPKYVLNPAGTRIKDPKYAKAFILKGKHYLLHTRVRGKFPLHISVPFERLDVAADAAAPPFSCHKVPIVSCNKVPTGYDNPISARSRFVIDNKLVLVFECFGEIRVFTPDDDSSGDGKWIRLRGSDYWSVKESFLSFVQGIPSTGIFLSELRIPGTDDDDIGVLLTFDGELSCDGKKTESSRVICAFAISTKTYIPKHFQRLGPVNTDSIPGHVWLKESFLQDLGKGDQERSRRICEITVATDRRECGVTTYISVSVFDVQLIEDPSCPNQFLRVFPPIKKLFVQILPDGKPRLSNVCNAFLV